jgi:sugar lactone lactonase YvrE
VSTILTEAKLVIESNSPLGEGPIWDHKTQVLWWVDILEGLVHRHDPADGANQSWSVEQMIGTIVTAQDGRLVIAAEKGFHWFDPETGNIELIVEPEPDKPQNRFNDGKCDPAGRLWAGTMPISEEGNSGILYCLHPDGKAETKQTGYAIPNGIVWNDEATIMYHIDSPTRRVDAWDYDNPTGSISNRRAVYHVQQEGAFPDGMAMDVEGKIWLALWGGWAVIRFDPVNGEELERIPVPVSRTSACAFGGPNLNTLFITTAKKDITPDELEKEPLAGCVFKTNPGVCGQPPVSFAG